MRILCRRVGFCFLLAAFIWCGTVIADRQKLNEELVRLHVVAASDSEVDQSCKLLVRDAILESLSSELQNVADAEQAKAYLTQMLPKLQEIAENVLQKAGCSEDVTVSLAEEAFDTRDYGSFSLPAGIYETLRITIGQGQGANWWCVVFPAFCAEAGEHFAQAAEAAGFPEGLQATLSGENGYEIRFYFLEVLGKLENLLHGA